MAVGNHQQQSAIAPRRHMAVLPGSRLQLAFQQALQVLQAFGLVKQQAQRAHLAQQCGGWLGRGGFVGHGVRMRLQGQQFNTSIACAGLFAGNRR